MKKIALCMISISSLMGTLASASSLDRKSVDAALSAVIPAAPAFTCLCPAGEEYLNVSGKAFCQKNVAATTATEISCPAGSFNTAKFGGAGDQCIKDVDFKVEPTQPLAHPPAAVVHEQYPTAPTYAVHPFPNPTQGDQRYANEKVDKANDILKRDYHAKKDGVDRRNAARVDAYNAAVKAEAKIQSDWATQLHNVRVANNQAYQAAVAHATTAKCAAGQTQIKLAGAADQCWIPGHMEYDRVLSCSSTSIIGVKITF